MEEGQQGLVVYAVYGIKGGAEIKKNKGLVYGTNNVIMYYKDS